MDGDNLPTAEPWQKEIQDLKSSIETLTNNWKRAVADYQNLEKRVEKERQNLLNFSNIFLLKRLLSVLDDLEKANSHLNDEGLDIVFRDLKNILREQGLGEIGVKVGDSFDPNFHECVELIKGGADQKVVEVIAKGYIIGEKVLRTAKVKVSKKEIEELKPEAEKESQAGNYV